MGVTPIAGIELFFSYSHKDRELRDELERHLSLLKRSGAISTWHDRQIGAGTEWAGQIDEHLERARIILLLVSADFLSSDYCYDVEVRRAMERHAEGTARVIPVILRSVDWAGAVFSGVQAVPTGALPVTSWPNRDEAFSDVGRAIRKAIAEVAAESSRVGAGLESPSCYPVEQRQLIDDKARVFVGREDVIRALDEFVESQSRGYFIVEGAPGQGKSALAAWLVRARKLVHHFIAHGGDRSDPRVILGAMLEQLTSAVASAQLGNRSIDQLRDHFERALRKKVAEVGPVVVVVDALNEYPTGSNDLFPFLPIDVPDHVFFLLTSQPNQRVEMWKEQLTGVPHRTVSLRRLDDHDVVNMIGQLHPDLDERARLAIVNAARGTPLYVRAALDSLEREPWRDVTELPESVEGYFKRATRSITEEGLLRDVLGLLAVCRRKLSLYELGDILGISQRRVYTDGILGVRQFLAQSDLHYGLYHQLFHDFVVRELIFSDELRHYHKLVADWLDKPASENLSYRWTSLSYHLFYAQSLDRLVARVDERFLRSKVHRFGYAVLEDIEYLARALLETGDAGVVERCVTLVEGLRSIVGDVLIDDLAQTLQGNRGAIKRDQRTVIHVVESTTGLEIHGIMIPNGAITADFIEVASTTETVMVAIGDAPSRGLKSAFVARFIATVFQRLADSADTRNAGRIVSELNRLLFRHDYFERVSMQCIDIAPAQGTIAIANAGHPYPVLYNHFRGACDILEVRGPLLHDVTSGARDRTQYDERHAEIQEGDLLILVTDGLTEAGRLDGDAYGYRFTKVVEECSRRDAKSVCEAIVNDWRYHRRDDLSGDDVSVLVVEARKPQVTASPNAD